MKAGGRAAEWCIVGDDVQEEAEGENGQHESDMASVARSELKLWLFHV